MKTINATQFGIKDGENITKALCSLLLEAQKDEIERTLVFEKGTYYINSGDCQKHMLFITNTVGDGEFKKGETPHENAVPFYLKNAKNLTIDANDSVFVIDGKVTNMAFEACENLTVKNLEIVHVNPDMHEFKVVKKGAFFVDFELDGQTKLAFENGTGYFCGTDFHRDIKSGSKTANWIGLVRKETENRIERVRHPLFGCLKIERLEERKIRCRFLKTGRFKLGDRFYVYDVRRQFAGIFINKCKNVSLENIKQRFNYSLALVLQDSENVLTNDCIFAPDEKSEMKMASCADFVQACMCRGKLTFKNNVFVGAGDDCINVHGVHFKIKKAEENQLTLAFMHPQTHGYNPFHPGDELAFIDPDTLLEKARTKLLSAELSGEHEIVARVQSAPEFCAGLCIENVSACPEVEFDSNLVDRIITRGFLLTTRGKTVISNNRFANTTMSAILLSDDAKNWFESGMCKDVLIEKNTFDYCGGVPILIKPENAKYGGAVHENIKIHSNVFKEYKGVCIDAKATDNIDVSKNDFCGGKIIKTSNCRNVAVQSK